MMGRLHKFFFGIVFAVFFTYANPTTHAATITYSKTFVDGEVLTANDLETMKSDITAVVNAGGGPVTLTSSQTVSGGKTFSGANTFSSTNTFSDVVTFSGTIAGGSPFIFEGAGVDAFELTLTIPDPTADVTYTLQGSVSVSSTIKSWQNAGTSDVSIVFEGATADDFEATITITDPTADRTLTFGDQDANLPEQLAEAWANLDGTGTIALRDSFNVSGVGDNSAGDYTFTWDTDFSADTYATVSAAGAYTGASGSNVIASFTDKAVGTVNTMCTTDGGAAADVEEYMVIAIGDQ